jgi:hypothetical protein
MEIVELSEISVAYWHGMRAAIISQDGKIVGMFSKVEDADEYLAFKLGRVLDASNSDPFDFDPDLQAC